MEIYGLTDEEYAQLLLNENLETVRCFTHVHTDMGSPLDAILTCKQYVQRAKELGCKYITVTDHGTMYAVKTLYEECEKAGITLIVGVEFYVRDDEDMGNKSMKHVRLHLCGYAVNRQGFLTLSRLVSESNKGDRVIVSGKQQYPCISRKILEKYMGPGTPGHGNVILTSACMAGVIMGLSLEQDNVAINLERLKTDYKKHKMAYDQAIYANEQIDNLESQKQDATAEQKKTITSMVREFKKTITASNKVGEKLGAYNMVEFKEALDKEASVIKELEKSDNSHEELVNRMKEAAIWYDNIAGHGNFYIEIQYHGIDIEKKYEHILCDIAHELNIPLIAGIDAHMLKKEDAQNRAYINSLRSKKYYALEESDKELYLKSDQDLYKWLRKAVTSKYATEAVLNQMRLAERCHVELKKEPHYPSYIPSAQEETIIASIPDFMENITL